MQVIETDLPGVIIIEPRVFRDDRGFFVETYQFRKLREFGIDSEFVQDNHSRSSRGTLRGLHYQLRHPQAKLCRVVRGEVFDVAVDIRRGSPTFGRWTGVLLSEENQRSIYVPRGFAHGFLVLSESVDFLYKCDAYYTPGDEYGIAWGDPALEIEWPLHGLKPLLSAKDQIAPRLSEAAIDTLPIYPTFPADMLSASSLTTHA